MQKQLAMFKSAGDSLIDLLPWSPPRRVTLKEGSVLIRKAKVTPDFRRFFKLNIGGLQKAGVSLVKVGKEEMVEWKRDLLSENAERNVWEKEVKKFIKTNLNFKVNMKGLLKYQEIAVKRNVYALENYGFSLEGSDTGYGKTYVAFAAARHCNLDLFVITPKATLTPWKRVAEHMGMLDRMVCRWGSKRNPRYAINVEKLKTGKTGFGHFVEKCNANGDFYDEWVWTLPDGVLLVFDELQKFKGMSSQNAQLLLAANRQEIPTMGMSATAANDPTHMRGLGYILGLHDGTEIGFYRWARENGCAAGNMGTLTYYGGLTVLSQLHKEIFPEHGNRQRIADLDDFPDTRITADTYDMGSNTKHIAKAYRDMQKELDDLALAAAKAKNPLTIILRARQKIELLKVPAMAEMTKDAIAEGMSIAIFVNFEETIQQLGKALKTDCFIHGGQSETERQFFIDQFQADKERIILCNIRAGGCGISLHDLNGTYSRLSLIAPSWSAMDLVQALGRIHRAGGLSKSIQRIVFAAKTIEEGVCEKVNKKLKDLSMLNDGDCNAGCVLF